MKKIFVWCNYGLGFKLKLETLFQKLNLFKIRLVFDGEGKQRDRICMFSEN